MQILPAQPADVEEATKCFVAAFATDPLIDFFFHDSPQGRDRAAEAFFDLLLRARVALQMPVLLARDGSRLLGAAMGYTTERPDWPAPLEREMHALEGKHPALASRFAAYERIADATRPPGPHYYLGVIGVAPGLRGRGVGAALLRGFCELSLTDLKSSGVYLETANPDNLRFYERHGFAQRGGGSLGTVHLWCLFHAHGRSV